MEAASCLTVHLEKIHKRVDEQRRYRQIKELCQRKLQKLCQRRLDFKSKIAVQKKGNHKADEKSCNMRNHIIQLKQNMQQQINRIVIQVFTTPTTAKRINSGFTIFMSFSMSDVCLLYQVMRPLFRLIINAPDVFADNSEAEKLNAAEKQDGGESYSRKNHTVF